MAYKLIEAAQHRWRAVNAPHLVALARNGAVFHKGKLPERPTNLPRPITRPPTPARKSPDDLRMHSDEFPHWLSSTQTISRQHEGHA